MVPCLAASLRTCLKGVSDPRNAHARRHPLPSILFLALTAVIGGADTWVEVEEFGRDHRAWFEPWLRLPHGIPSHDTFGRVFALLDPEQLEMGFARWVQTLHGKTARRSHDRSHEQSTLHTVSAYACESRLVLVQTAVDAQSNEIPALPEVLALLNLAGTTVTVDAMGCQKDLARHIRSQQADYVLTVKDNQRTLRTALEETFAEERRVQFEDCPHTAHRTVNGATAASKFAVAGLWATRSTCTGGTVARPVQPPAGEDGTTGGRPGRHRNPLLHFQPSPRGPTPVGNHKDALDD